MKLSLTVNIEHFPKEISAFDALIFHRNESEKHNVLMVVAKGWRDNPETGEEDWFEELTCDEFDSEDFLLDFQEATFQLWMR